MLLKSMAGSETKYVALQARVTKSGKLHFQGIGKEVNRPYGVSFTLKENLGFALKENLDSFNYLQTLKTEYLSKHSGSSKLYFPIQATFYENGTLIHFQITGPKLNRDYGASFSIPTEEFPSDFIGFLKLELFS